MQIDSQYAAKLQKIFPKEFEQQYTILERENKLVGDKISIDLQIGNTYRHIKNPTYCRDGTPNEHGWACFVRMKETKMEKYMPFIIEQATFNLHPTAAVRKKVIKTDIHDKNPKPVQISYAGWGYYEIPIEVKFR